MSISKRPPQGRILLSLLTVIISFFVLDALADVAQAGTQPTSHVSNMAEDLSFIVAITLLALATPFVFAWAGDPKTWHRSPDQPRQMAARSGPRDPALKTLAWIFFVALLVQSFHMSEHVAQVIQKFPLAGQSLEAHGILGSFFDREWVHLLYNFLYFSVISILLLGYRSALKGSPGDHGLFLTLLWFVFLIEGYHLAEHGLKVMQFLQWGVQDTPGLAGQFFPGIWVHFIYNLIVYLPTALAFFGGGVYQAMFGRRPSGAPAAAKR